MGARLSCWRAVLHDGGMTRPITIAAIVAIAAVALTVAARAADDKPLGPHSYIIFCGIVPGTCTWVGETQPGKDASSSLAPLTDLSGGRLRAIWAARS